MEPFLTLSAQGRALLQSCEGCEPRCYDDGVGYQTIGIGHRLTRSELASGKLWIGGTAVRYEGGLSRGEIEALLSQDLQPVERAIAQAVTVPLAPHQFDALVLFAFNVGLAAFRQSTLLKRLNAGAYADVPAQLQRWVYAGGVVVEGLKRRRALEAQLWRGQAWPPGTT
jgi:lysozyme